MMSPLLSSLLFSMVLRCGHQSVIHIHDAIVYLPCTRSASGVYVLGLVSFICMYVAIIICMYVTPKKFEWHFSG